MARRTSILAGIALAGALAAGGAAFTATNSMPAGETVGYGTTTVSGATVNSIKYNPTGDGSQIATVDLVLAGDTSALNVSIGLNGSNTVSCGTGDASTGDTAYSCDVSSLAQSTDGLSSTAILVNTP